MSRIILIGGSRDGERVDVHDGVEFVEMIKAGESPEFVPSMMQEECTLVMEVEIYRVTRFGTGVYISG